MNQDLSSMDSNQILNSLDDLLAQGNSINDIVSALDGVRTIASYQRLVDKGATNIDLATLVNEVDPEVVLNNIAIFDDNNVKLNIPDIAAGLSSGYWRYIDERDVDFWTDRGLDPQIVADRFIENGGIYPEIVQALSSKGVRISADRLVDNLIKDDEYLIEDFYADDDVPALKRAGASEESIQKLLKRISELSVEDDQATYGGPYPDKLDINETGPQAVKIFFAPQIQVIAPSGGYELQVDWAGRVLPGQTIQQGVATGLKEVYGYTGKFEWRNPYFKEWAKDNQGVNVQRYGMYVTLFPEDDSRILPKL